MFKFEYSFTDIDPKIIKKNKSFKKKCKYTLKEAEFLVKWLQNNWNDKTSITLVCTSKEEKTSYEFDNIEVVPFEMGGKETSLFAAVESQILTAPDNMISDSNSLILNINSQYQQEPDLENETSVEQNSKEKKFKKIGLSIPKIPFIKTKNDGKGSEDGLKVYEEYLKEGIPELEDSVSKVEEINGNQKLPVVEEEREVEEKQEVEETEEVSFEDEEIEDFEGSLTTTFDEVKQPHSTELQNDYLYSQNNNFAKNSYDQSSTLAALKKHETVVLPTPTEYCDLGEDIEESIQNMIEKLKSENLYKFIGILPVGISNTRIDEYRQNYAMLRLSEATFENIREHYYRETTSLKNGVLTTLRDAVSVAWKKGYDLEIFDSKKYLFDEIDQATEEKLESFIQKQTDLSDNRLDKFIRDQELEMQQFRAKQESDKSAFVTSEFERTQNIIDSKSEVLKSESKIQKEELLDEEMYKLKFGVNQNLFDGKRQAKKDLAFDIAEANEDIWNQVLSKISDIQNEIENKTPLWAKEIKEFNILEQQEHQRNKEIKEMSLKEESIAIKRLEAEIDVKKMEELDHENKMLKIKLETANSAREIFELELRQQNQLSEYRKNSVPNLKFLSGVKR